jgi:uncharacterized protein (TIGR03067 family)
MKTRLAAVILLGTAFAAVGVAAGGDAKKDLKRLTGTWAVESAIKGGKALPEDEIAKVRFKFDGEKVTFKEGDKEEEGTIKIDPSKKPKHIDVTLKGKTHEGIYRFLKGGKLTVCVAVGDGEARPTKFESPEGSKIILVVLKREKKE